MGRRGGGEISVNNYLRLMTTENTVCFQSNCVNVQGVFSRGSSSSIIFNFIILQTYYVAILVL